MFKQIKLVLKSVREYKKYAILTPLFMVLEVALECLLPFVMSQFVNKIETTNVTNFSELVPYIIVLVIMAMGSLLCGVMAGQTEIGRAHV